MRFAVVVALIASTACGNRTPERTGVNRDAADRSRPGPGSDGDGDVVVAPGLRLPDGVEPLGYRLALDIDPAADEFHGDIELKLVLAAPRDHVWLHAVDLELGAIDVDVGGDHRTGMVRPETGVEMVAIDLGGTAPAGLVTVRIKYVGQYHDRDQVGLFREKDGGKTYVYSQLEAVHARKLAPCLDEPRFKVPWQITLDVPAGLTAVANSPATDTIDHDDGRTVHFAPTDPIPSYLVAVAVGPFATIELGRVGANKLPLRVIAPAGTRPSAVAVVRELTPRVVASLEAYLGIPLPFAKLDLVAVPEFFGAMENPGLIMFARDLLLVGSGPISRADYIEIAAHEIAHQWFGNLVTLAWWDDLWLNESFATWMATKVARELTPARDDAVSVHDGVETAMRADASPTTASLRRDIKTNADAEAAFDAIAYEKGAAVIAMFEVAIGEDKLKTAIHGYLAAHAGKVTDSTGLLDAIEQASDAGMRAAFASFVDHPGVPLITLERRCDGGKVAIRVTQERLVPIGSAPAGGGWRLPVCVRFPTATGHGEGCVTLAGPTAEIALPDVACPAWLIGNAGDRGYYRARVDASLIPPLTELTPRERLGLIGGVAALIDAGQADPALVAHLVPSLLASGQANDERAAIALIRATEPLIDDAGRPAWQAWARRMLAPAVARARADDAPPGDGGKRRLRRDRIALAAVALGDDRVIGQARARADRWLAGTQKIKGNGELGLVLETAARRADKAFADRLLAKAATLPVGEERGAVLAALGDVSDPEATKVALAPLVDPAFQSHDLAAIPAGLAERPATRALLLDLYRDEDLRARFVSKLVKFEAAETVIEPFAAVCDPTEKQATLAVLTPIAAELDDGAHVLAATTEQIDRCIARRAALGPKLAALIAAPP